MEIEIGELVVDNEIKISDVELEIIKQYPELEDLEVTPSSVEQTFTHPNSYGYDEVKVKGVEASTINITPTKENQQHIGLYGTVNVSGVTSSIDSNIVPNNIKNGVTILGVTGDLTDQLDASADDTLQNMNLQSATRIRNYCFRYCNNLKHVTLGYSVKNIGDNAFDGCPALESVIIENGVTLISLQAFRYCTSLITVDLGTALANLGASSFYSCSALKHIKIPSRVSIIRNQTFYGCASMEYYDFTDHTTIPSLQGTDAFYSIPATCKIVVPDDLYETWITRTNWSNFASNIIKESEWNA